MALPDGGIIPLDVVADRWTKIFGELVTVERLRSWHNAGILTVDSRADFLWRTRGSQEDRIKVFPSGFIMHEDWITREERDRFESEYVPDTSRQSDLDYLMCQFLDNEPGGGAAGFFRFMDNKDAKFKGKMMKWTDPTGKNHEVAMKTATNKLSKLKKKRREQFL